MRRAAKRVPVRLDFEYSAGRFEAWGWLDELAAASARLSSASELRRGEMLRLSFEVAGEAFSNLRARVRFSERDDDGYFDAELEFPDQLERRRLARALLDVLSRAI